MAKTQAVEATGKRWKGLTCLGTLALVAGVFCLVLSWTGAASLWGWGAGLAGAGIAVRLLAAMGTWWFHS